MAPRKPTNDAAGPSTPKRKAPAAAKAPSTPQTDSADQAETPAPQTTGRQTYDQKKKTVGMDVKDFRPFGTRTERSQYTGVRATHCETHDKSGKVVPIDVDNLYRAAAQTAGYLGFANTALLHDFMIQPGVKNIILDYVMKRDKKFGLTTVTTLNLCNPLEIWARINTEGLIEKLYLLGDCFWFRPADFDKLYSAGMCPDGAKSSIVTLHSMICLIRNSPDHFTDSRVVYSDNDHFDKNNLDKLEIDRDDLMRALTVLRRRADHARTWKQTVNAATNARNNTQARAKKTADKGAVSGETVMQEPDDAEVTNVEIDEPEAPTSSSVPASAAKGKAPSKAKGPVEPLDLPQAGQCIPAFLTYYFDQEAADAAAEEHINQTSEELQELIRQDKEARVAREELRNAFHPEEQHLADQVWGTVETNLPKSAKQSLGSLVLPKLLHKPEQIKVLQHLASLCENIDAPAYLTTNEDLPKYDPTIRKDTISSMRHKVAANGDSLVTEESGRTITADSANLLTEKQLHKALIDRENYDSLKKLTRSSSAVPPSYKDCCDFLGLDYDDPRMLPNMPLQPHQVEAVAWSLMREDPAHPMYDLNGCVFGHECGLGKTRQALARIVAKVRFQLAEATAHKYVNKDGYRPKLIVCPAGLMETIFKEFARTGCKDELNLVIYAFGTEISISDEKYPFVMSAQDFNMDAMLNEGIFDRTKQATCRTVILSPYQTFASRTLVDKAEFRKIVVGIVAAMRGLEGPLLATGEGVGPDVSYTACPAYFSCHGKKGYLVYRTASTTYVCFCHGRKG